MIQQFNGGVSTQSQDYIPTYSSHHIATMMISPIPHLIIPLYPPHDHPTLFLS
jgi:hypothetical protein